MPTGDLHGSTIQIETGKGEKTTFELVRIGTVKEFETVKAALATSKAAAESLDGLNSDLQVKLAHKEEVRFASEAAYTAEKEAREDSNEERGRLHGLLESEKELGETLLAERDKARTALANTSSQLASEKTAHEATGRDLGSARAELKDLMTVKEALEQTQTTLDVRDKELCEERESHTVTMANHDRYRKERDDIKAAFGSLTERQARGERELLYATRERDASRAAMADLKAELLKDADSLSVVLDALHEKLTGE